MNPTPDFMEAIKRHRRLVDTLGMDHADTMRAMMQAMELAPNELIDEFGNLAREMGLMPKADGYLEDGSPMYRSPVDAEEAIRSMHAEREALDLSNAGIVTDATRIHRQQ